MCIDDLSAAKLSTRLASLIALAVIEKEKPNLSAHYQDNLEVVSRQVQRRVLCAPLVAGVVQFASKSLWSAAHKNRHS